MQRFAVESSSTSASSSRARASKRTRSASSSTSPDDDDGDCSQLPAGKNELTLATLQMFPGEADESGGNDSFASQNGKDPQRIRKLMKGKVCHCSQNCRRKLNVGTILTVCSMFWSLSKSAQDCVLWGIQQPVVQQSGSDSDSDSGSSSSSSSSNRTRRMSTWFLQGAVALFIVERLILEHLPSGIQVCREAFCRILGISGWQLVRTKRRYQGEDYRRYGALS